MKERPILFSAPMVRALLDGHKTQTRRPLTFNLANACTHAGGATSPAVLSHCPYGQPGDRLWVREAWRTYKSLDECPPRSIESGAGLSYIADEITKPDGFGRYRHARFMPRWVSRITLEVVVVKVERLWDIDANGAIAEGFLKTGDSTTEFSARVRAFHAFSSGWNAIYAATYAATGLHLGWGANPWVWVVEFRRVEA